MSDQDKRDLRSALEADRFLQKCSTQSFLAETRSYQPYSQASEYKPYALSRISFSLLLVCWPLRCPISTLKSTWNIYREYEDLKRLSSHNFDTQIRKKKKKSSINWTMFFKVSFQENAWCSWTLSASEQQVKQVFRTHTVQVYKIIY